MPLLRLGIIEEQGFTGQFRAFARTVLAGSRAALDPGDQESLPAGSEDGVRALELVEAVRASAARGLPVAVSTRQSEAIPSTPGAHP
jgi:predicted dehydrogenase